MERPFIGPHSVHLHMQATSHLSSFLAAKMPHGGQSAVIVRTGKRTSKFNNLFPYATQFALPLEYVDDPQSTMTFFLLSTLVSLPLVTFTLFLIIVYTFYCAVYRLYLSPIAKFPGPPFAALTFWNEFYYDVIRGGRYTWKIGEYHEKYGEHSPLVPLLANDGKRRDLGI